MRFHSGQSVILQTFRQAVPRLLLRPPWDQQQASDCRHVAGSFHSLLRATCRLVCSGCCSCLVGAVFDTRVAQFEQGG